MKARPTDGALFQVLEEAAAQGARCPTTAELAKRFGVIGAANTGYLARDLGLIRIEVYAHNWRVVEICQGPHKGKRTQERPGGGKPYLVIEKGGATRPRLQPIFARDEERR